MVGNECHFSSFGKALNTFSSYVGITVKTPESSSFLIVASPNFEAKVLRTSSTLDPVKGLSAVLRLFLDSGGCTLSAVFSIFTKRDLTLVLTGRDESLNVPAGRSSTSALFSSIHSLKALAFLSLPKTGLHLQWPSTPSSFNRLKA
ncbi:hypothetical protein BANRA_04046 [Acinetobacter baumannii]|nr:hypothetical protein BANRA_04046 [Acinetobacter baumannii]